MPLILPSNSISAVGYDVANSLRFDDGSSDYLNKTYGSNGTRTTWTFSTWIKRANLSFDQRILSCDDDASGNQDDFIKFLSGDNFQIGFYNSGFYGERTTNRVFRDVSAWYHIVVVWDTTNATADDRIRLYVNGTRETSFSSSTNPSSSATSFINSTSYPLEIGRRGLNGTQYINGYLAETVFIDGQALDPTSFGETDEDTGIWKPIDVSGLTFGTNGFYLDFENSGSLGADVSGNGNNFTVNNLTSIDQTTDTPTNNYCTLNPTVPSLNLTFSQGNLQLDTSGSDPTGGGLGTIGVSQGKWYWEVKFTSNPANHTNGIISELTNPYQTALQNKTGVTQYHNDDGGEVSVDGSFGNNNYGTLTTGDILGIALNVDDSQISFYKNGTALVTGFTISTTRGTLFPLIKMGLSTTAEVNFGNPPFTISSGNSDDNGYGNFEYQPPSGYLALNTKNLATDG